jgi:DNA-binding transcriptional ArsR family regulator
MSIDGVAKALSSTTRLRILKILSAGEASAIGVYRKYNAKYSDKKERVSIYRDLEILSKSNLVYKKYNGESKEIVYGLASRTVSFDLASQVCSLGQ